MSTSILRPRHRPTRGCPTGGVYAAQLVLNRRGTAALDGRTVVARQLGEDRKALYAHLGGEPSVTQERVVEAVLLLDLIITMASASLATLGPVDRKGALRPLARDIGGMLERRHRLLSDLGWPRQARPVMSLSERLSQVTPPTPLPPQGGGVYRGGPIRAELQTPITTSLHDALTTHHNDSGSTIAHADVGGGGSDPVASSVIQSGRVPSDGPPREQTSKPPALPAPAADPLPNQANLEATDQANVVANQEANPIQNCDDREGSHLGESDTQNCADPEGSHRTDSDPGEV